MRHSQVLSDLLSKMSSEGFEQAQDVADSTCTSGYDNDGSTGFEIFENGFDLAVKANGRDVIYGEGTDDVCLFFIASEEEALAKIKERLDEMSAEIGSVDEEG